MAYRHITVYSGATKLRTFGGNGSEVRYERDQYDDFEYRKEKHPHLTDYELNNLVIIYK